MAVMIDEVKFIFYSVLVGKGAREACFGSHGYSPARYLWAYHDKTN